MPTNVTIEFEKAKRKYEDAKSLVEKLKALQEMQREAPKHKGAEKLRAEISRKMASVRAQMERQKEQAKKVGRKTGLSVRKEGAGQIVIIGLPNSGKSSLLKALTNADVEIADYPFTTVKPEVGMVEFNGALIQLVEIPALVEGSAQGKAQGIQLLSIIRNADGIIMLANSLDELELLKTELRQADIWINESKPKITIKKSKFPGISVAGKKFLKIPVEELIDFLKSMGLHNVSVLLEESTSLKKVEQVLDESITYKKALVLTRNKSLIKELEIKAKGKAISIGGLKDEKLIKELKKELFELLDRIIVYTKKPGREAVMNKPLVLKKGATVEDAAKELHKDFAKNLRYAKVWGSSKFPEQRVQKEYALKSGDIIEIYI